VNRKASTLILASFLVIGLASAQSVQIEDADEFPTELTGGESFSLGLNYSVDSPDEVPLSLEFKAFYNGTEVDEKEAFDLSVGGEECEGFRCNLNDTDEDGGVELEVDSNPRLQPGSFGFEVDILSAVGVGQEVESVNISTGENPVVEGQGSSVTIQSEVNGSANVTELDFVGAEPPSTDSQFLGGVEVEVRDDEGRDSGNRSSGTVRIDFDEDDLDTDTVAIHLYNESSGEWEELDSDVGDGFVEADVDHFSVYSAFGEQEDSGGSSFSVSADESDVSDERTQNESGDQDEGTQEDETQENEGADNETQQEDQEQEDSQDDETQQDESVDEPTDTLTGQFVQQASNPMIVGILALLALIAAGIYTDKLNSLQRRISGIR
jgi:hypothetical protein